MTFVVAFGILKKKKNWKVVDNRFIMMFKLSEVVGYKPKSFHVIVSTDESVDTMDLTRLRRRRSVQRFHRYPPSAFNIVARAFKFSGYH